MVTINPLLAAKWPNIKRFKATGIYYLPARLVSGIYWIVTSMKPDIWLEVFFFTMIATMVATLTELTDHDLGISNTLLTVLGTVLALVISFRTSSAYEMYQEGRKVWTSIALASRRLGQLLWIHVPVDRPAGINGSPGGDADGPKGTARLKSIIEKRSMINLVQAFSVAVKHFLRAEPGIYYEDLYPLVSLLPRNSLHPSSEPTLQDVLPIWIFQALQQSKPHEIPQCVAIRNQRPKTTMYDYFPPLIIFQPVISGGYWLYIRMFKRHHGDVLERETRESRGSTPPQPIDLNVPLIPLEITLFLHSYVEFLLHKGLVQPGVASDLVTNLCTLQDAVTDLERVRNTPIPFAYQAHLRVSLWIYLTLLPFQIILTMHWLTIPATCFASFLLVSFLEIGQGIEDLFDDEKSDLALDAFCLAIQRELHEITAHPAPDPHTYIFGPFHQPFAPADRRNAEEIVSDTSNEYHHPETGIDHVRRTLLKNWREIEEAAWVGRY